LRAFRVNVQCACARGSLMPDISQWINYTLCNSYFWFNSNIMAWQKYYWFEKLHSEMPMPLSIYILCLSAFLFVCFLYPINVQTADMIGPKFCVVHHITPGKVYEWLKFQKLASYKIRLSLNFENPRNF